MYIIIFAYRVYILFSIFFFWSVFKIKDLFDFLRYLFKDFTLDFYFRQFWTDPRLAFNKQPGIETLSVGSEFIKNIWVPDTFFVNEKTSYFHTVSTNNEFIRIHHTGSITRSMRYITTTQ